MTSGVIINKLINTTSLRREGYSSRVASKTEAMTFSSTTCGYLLALSFAVVASPAPAADPTGEQLYRDHCVRCHGSKGEGTKKYDMPLVGEKSVAQLAKVIDETMPEGNPEKLDAKQSAKVAAYTYETFYSPEAQARLNPPRIELARLTVGQYRNAIADLLGSFREPAPKWGEERGLHGEYYNARNFRGSSVQVERTDPQVAFDFGTKGPAEKFDPHQFSIRWEGSVLAPETGEYEFIVRTDHATRLWVNDTRAPVIDRFVKSGSDTEFKANLFLLGGRAYPVRLEFSKAKQGVDDSKKNPNPPPKPAFIKLLWKRPHGVAEVIPARLLTPQRFPEVAVVDVPFPPDDRSLGWERGTRVTKDWEAATTEGALAIAAHVSDRLPELMRLRSRVDNPDRDRAPGRARQARPPRPTPDRNQLREFCRAFAERAFRRPLTEAEVAHFVDRQFEAAAGDMRLAVKRVVLVVLKSPRFLYPDAADGPEQFEVASRLALALWDAPPDRELLDAAAAGKLATREEVARQADRMLADPRAKAKIREFFLVWLKLDQVKELTKDLKRFADFDAAVAADLRTSLELFVDDVMWSPSSDFRQLFLANETFLNGRLAKFSGVDLPADAPFRKTEWEADRRFGVLTHPYLLAVLAYSAESSPIHRGVFVGRGLLGINIRPPVDAFSPLAPSLHPGLTTRERVVLQTKPAACASCHSIMNPLGFSLENYDAVGRYREKDNGKPVDAAGGFETKSDEIAKFEGAKDLAKFLAGSEEAQTAFIQQLFHHLVKQPVRAYGFNRPEQLRKSFAENDYNMRELMVEIATLAAMRGERGP